ncbi:MAG TPA: glycosyltransferase [Egibacteraceae bacterium]|nr:glycosyltransferase [Egibacteraceae bacterium]
MKVLLSAIWCEPGRGGEQEVGWQAVLAATRRHEVWVLTHPGSVRPVQEALRARRLADRAHIEGVSLGGRIDRFLHTGTLRFHAYQDRWQRRAKERARELDEEVDFDLVHHATLCAYWTRAGVGALGKPFVWGPLGGGVEAPLPLIPELGVRGMGEFLLRRTGRGLLARHQPIARLQRQAAVAWVANVETAAVVASPGRTVIYPQGACASVEAVGPPPARTHEVVFVGRLIPWKACKLAVRTLRHMRRRDAVLHVYGNGPDRGRVERAVKAWGLQQRVVFEGHVERKELHRRLARAAVLLHPALHDESTLAVAEALSFGTPVVCLAHGGPRELVRHWPASPSFTVAPSSPGSTARVLAAAVDRFMNEPAPIPPGPLRPTTAFSETLLRAYEQAATHHMAVGRHVR